MVDLTRQKKTIPRGINKAIAIISIALLVVLVVWSVFQRHIAAIREQAEEQALERLIIDTKLLQSSLFSLANTCPGSWSKVIR